MQTVPDGQQMGPVDVAHTLAFGQQTPPTSTVFGGHVHLPLTQICPVGQQTVAVTGEPQMLAWGQHVPLIMTVPGGHAHVPLTQICPAGQQMTVPLAPRQTCADGQHWCPLPTVMQS